MQQHTPGPWIANHFHVAARGPGIEDHCIVGRVDGCTGQEALANARLIAAAPDLLEALIEMASGHSMAGEARARAAIAKATGRA